MTIQSFYCTLKSYMPLLGKTRKDVIKEFRTAELLCAARRVFAEKGFHAATVDDIASAAGVAKGTVYLYYRSKQEVYWGALEHGITELHNGIQARLAAEETPENKVRAFIEIKIRYFELNRDFFRIYFSELGSGFSHPAQMPPQFEQMYLRQARMLEAILQQGVESGSIRQIRTDTAAVAISDLIRGIIVQRLLGWSTKDVESDVNFVFDLVWRGIAA
jgi:AcrR family transcriptional regulator